MTFATADVTRIWVHHSQGIKAKATQVTLDGTSWLDILSLAEGKIIATFFMPYETAQEYASAINACNDREAAEAMGPTEITRDPDGTDDHPSRL